MCCREREILEETGERVGEGRGGMNRSYLYQHIDIDRKCCGNESTLKFQEHVFKAALSHCWLTVKK